MTTMKPLRATLVIAAGLAVLPAANAFDVTYKCPGHVYSNTMTPKEAKDKGCTVLDNAPITVIQSQKPKTPSAVSSGPKEARVDPTEQRARDSDARRILESELRREENRLTEMKAEYKDGTPDRQGNEIRNFQKYLDRVAEMKSAITRKEGDIAALKREIAKLPPLQ